MADIATVTPELEANCRKLIADNNIDVGKGPYAPTTYNRSRVIFPSEIGGANWGGMSFNPTLGYLFVNVNDIGQLNGNKDPESGPVDVATLAGSNLPGGRTGPYANVSPSGRFRDPATGMFCNQPPWGELVAVNVNTGDIAWKVPLGVTDTPARGQAEDGPAQHRRFDRDGRRSRVHRRDRRFAFPRVRRQDGQGTVGREAERVIGRRAEHLSGCRRQAVRRRHRDRPVRRGADRGRGRRLCAEEVNGPARLLEPQRVRGVGDLRLVDPLDLRERVGVGEVTVSLAVGHHGRRFLA